MDQGIPIMINVLGWAETVRHQKKRTFVELRVNDSQPTYFNVVLEMDDRKNVHKESYIDVCGHVAPLPPGASARCTNELHACELTILSGSDTSFSSKCPSDAKDEIKLANRHLYIREQKSASMIRLRSALVDAIRGHFKKTSCVEIFPPSFVPNQCEGGSTLFKIDHPARDSGFMPAYLTQSSQFYLEYAVPAVGDCFCIAPSYRAERSQTRRHLTEFPHAECEWQGVLSLEHHLSKLTDMMKGILDGLLSESADLLNRMGLLERVGLLRKMCDDIRVLTHKEAINYCRENEIYKDAETKTHFDDNDDIPEMQERAMIDKIGEIVFLTRFPKDFKSFYFLKHDDGTVFGCDVECPGVGEVIGSGVREFDHDRLLASIVDNGLNPDDYREYLDLRKYGSGRTSGMGLGVDRFLTWIANTHSIRDVVTFPRYPGHLSP